LHSAATRWIFFKKNIFSKKKYAYAPRIGHVHTEKNIAMAHRRLHVAIIGTGPSGFYTAKYLLKKLPHAC
jgi:hypothetical protein